MAARSITNGLFITLEGGECGGKSTQSQRLSARLRDQGYDVLETREPGGTRVGESLRDLLKHVNGDDAPCAEAELLMFGASRAQLMAKVIRPHLEAGGIVICDRFADSTTVYQGYARGLDMDAIQNIHSIAVADRWPDLTVVLDLDPQVAYERGQSRKQDSDPEDRFEEEARTFHVKVRDGFLDLAAKFPDRFRVVDAGADIDAVEQQIWEAVNHALT